MLALQVVMVENSRVSIVTSQMSEHRFDASSSGGITDVTKQSESKIVIEKDQDVVLGKAPKSTLGTSTAKSFFPKMHACKPF